ncbi:hypothetical protein RGU70_09930 [Herbaspirillum sp. RTI4]|uniref:hypothetical protein n=1 Tax=Herbaspirillum sp. RTI4 TaxID=3048640 RepID=UPI002AB3EEC0|nr:hypothetical protein [Herbaspirillum sp. RTI4]MDY7578641.1 hypothetical protein [Herbaspirillum sp. RTI4]MEA9980661.1 hypothetical protein [Herbaspirillum sp. RTI4]
MNTTTTKPAKTTRTKRWDGKIDSLTPAYLKSVTEQMDTYGDRVQFAIGSGQRPHYLVINRSEKKIAFDSNSHLLQPADDEFDGANATAIYTLEQVQAVIASGGKRPAAPRAARTTKAAGTPAARGITAAARAREAIDTEKYTYYKTNRQTLPAAIGEHSEEIAQLMSKGMSAEQAFGDVLKNHF